MNIPIYRAKKIDSFEYVEGFLIGKCNTGAYQNSMYIGEFNNYGYPSVKYRAIQIDPSTLSIHSHNMIAGDSDRIFPNGEKDLRIFASLSADGKGGDELSNEDDTNFTSIFNAIEGVIPYYENIEDYKIVGIKQ